MARIEACAIAVMAKAPQPGRSKTRLCPPLQPADAARLSAAFLRDVTGNIADAAREAAIAGFVAYAPAGLEPLFSGHLAPGTRLILADGDPASGGEMPEGVRGFGRSLLHAIRGLLDQGFTAACVLNSDSPTLPTEHLIRAARLLAAPGDRAVLGAAEDGGYYLLGMKAAHATLFADIDWSTGAVAGQTRARANAMDLPLEELPVWYDVDDAPALRRLSRETAEGAGAGYAAPATIACLDRLGLRDLIGTSGD